MTYTAKKIDHNKFIDLHINNLNNIQSIITRMSNIGYILIGLALSLTSIFIPLIFSLNISNIARMFLSICLSIILISLFISHLVNLKNEKLWRSIYNSKTKINLDKFNNNENKYEYILSIDFTEYKNDSNLKIVHSIKSWMSFVWLPLILFSLIIIGLVFIL